MVIFMIDMVRYLLLSIEVIFFIIEFLFRNYM